MRELRFLVDQDTPPSLAAALRQAAPGMDVIQVGDPGAPSLGTPDPDLLIAAATLGRVLISRDKKTMPGHLIAHFAAGRHTAGVMLLRNDFALAVHVRKIVNYWLADAAADRVDRTVYIP
jgi:Domain of unknown function (DUF5615)